MEVKPVRPQAKAIQDRFFKALNELIAMGKTNGLQTFCREYNLHKQKYSRLRTQLFEPDKISPYKFIDIDALYYLVNDYNVSADWLITGRGNMFKKSVTHQMELSESK